MTYWQEVYADCKRLGLCALCRKRDAVKGIHCQGCHVHQTARNRVWSYKAVRERREAEGMCVRCGKLPADDGVLSCPPCREKDRLRGRGYMYQSKLRRGEQEAKGGNDAWRALDQDRPVERCRCGLVMPCESCIPPLWAVAQSRRGPGRDLPDSPGF